MSKKSVCRLVLGVAFLWGSSMMASAQEGDVKDVWIVATVDGDPGETEVEPVIDP